MAIEVRHERALKCQQSRGVWGHAPPGKFLKLGALRSLLRPFIDQNATRISQPVVSVARRLNTVTVNRADGNDRLA